MRISNMTYPLLIVGVSAGIFAAPVSAAVILDTAAPNYTSQTRSDFGGVLTPKSQAGMVFQLTSDASITAASWWGSYANNSVHTDNFTLRIFNVSSGQPNVSPAIQVSLGTVTRNDTGSNSSNGNFDVYAYSVTLASAIGLSAGDYMLSLVNNSATTSPATDWAWASADGTDDGWVRSGDTVALAEAASWTDRGAMAFELVGDVSVPEPATLALFGLGLAGIGAIRRKKLVA